MSVPDAVLCKPGPLTPEERRQVETHAARGAQLIRHVPALAGVAAAIRAHHERWDGTGYPDGVVGPEIPLAARLVAIAAAYDAMTTDRPYRRALSLAVALADLQRNRGMQLHPDLVDLALAELGATRMPGATPCMRPMEQVHV